MSMDPRFKIVFGFEVKNRNYDIEIDDFINGLNKEFKKKLSGLEVDFIDGLQGDYNIVGFVLFSARDWCVGIFDLNKLNQRHATALKILNDNLDLRERIKEYCGTTGDPELINIIDMS